MYVISIILFAFAAVGAVLGFGGMLNDEAELVKGISLVALGAAVITLINAAERGREVSFPH